MANFPIDLHGHTTRSDGKDTPQEFIDHAVERGMKIVAITDHDIRPPETLTIAETGEEVPVLKYAADKGITVFRGIEVSCDTNVQDCHLVCFGCDWTDPWFDKLERDVIDSKIGSYRLLTDRLTEAGMPVSWEEVLNNNGNPIKPDQVQKKMIFELMAQKGYVDDWSQAKLLVKSTPEFSIARPKPDPCDVIRNVHRCGGIVIDAHPHLISEPVYPATGGKMTREEYLEILIAAGLDGIEARYTYDKTSYGGTKTPKEIEEEVKANYAHRLSIISAGSDYHADYKRGVKNAREMGDAGLTVEEFESNPILMKLKTLNTYQGH